MAQEVEIATDGTAHRKLARFGRTLGMPCGLAAFRLYLAILCIAGDRIEFDTTFDYLATRSCTARGGIKGKLSELEAIEVIKVLPVLNGPREGSKNPPTRIRIIG